MIWISVPVPGHTPQSWRGLQRQSSIPRDSSPCKESCHSQSRSSPASRWFPGQDLVLVALTSGGPAQGRRLTVQSGLGGFPMLVGEVLAPTVGTPAGAPGPLELTHDLGDGGAGLLTVTQDRGVQEQRDGFGVEGRVPAAQRDRATRTRDRAS